MKNAFKKFIKSPKTVIFVALVIAVIAGAMFVNMQNSSRATMFANDTVSPESTSTVASSQSLTLAFLVSGRVNNVAVKIGDEVKKGDVLATLDSENTEGAINQAKGAYASAQLAYEKLVNGSSDTDINIANVALANAKNNYNDTVSQQKVLVSNALSALNNSGLAAIPTTNTNTNNNTIISPIISGTYTGTDQGTYTITVNSVGSGYFFSLSGLETGNGNASTVAVPMGTKGLFIQFPANFTVGQNNTWTVSIPNTQSPTYLTMYNAYQSALQNQTQAIALAQGAIDSAQANLDQKVAGARSEDLEIAKAQVESTNGALEMAEGAYNNTVITAPTNGKITNVSISVGQIATANTPIIELLSN